MNREKYLDVFEQNLDDVFDSENEDEEFKNPIHDEEPPLEPRFKYDRLKGEDVIKLLNRELFTAIDIHDKFVALGTQSGKIYVMDHHGYADFKNVPILKPHRCAVSKIQFEETGTYILSCANDGKLVISGIGENKLCCIVNVSVMPKSIAIAPDFIKPNCSNFVMGERGLVLYEKRMFQYRTTSIYHGAERDGFINCASWSRDMIAMTNDSGTIIYDRNSKSEPITWIKPSHDVDRVRSSRAPPKHVWLPNDSLIVGWADTVTIIKVVEANGHRRGEVHYMWHVPMFVSGVSYVVNLANEMVELFLVGLQMEGEDLDDSASIVSSCTTLTGIDSSVVPILKTCVLRPLGLKDYELQSEDTIDNIKLNKHTLPCNIHAAGVPSLKTYFIVTLKEIILAVPYGPADMVAWRVKYKLWDEAFEMARNNADLLSQTEVNLQIVGRKMIQGFLHTERPKAAAARLPLVCGESKADWEWAVNLFERARLSTLLADVLPTASPQLEPENYEGVLVAAMYNDAKLFRRLVQLWSPDLYRTSYIINRTQWRVQELTKPEYSSRIDPEVSETERMLLKGVAHLYLYDRKFENALKIYKSCGDVEIFNVIDKHQLFEMVKDDISDLMRINSDRALRLLLDNEDCVPASFVMDKIARQPKLQMAYLTKLLGRNEGGEFADKAVQLYADYDRKRLLPFLRKNEMYHLNRALKICTQKKFVEEMIFLLAKGGNHYDAVKLMVEEYGSIDKVIEYCKDQNDKDLWLHVFDVVADTPNHIAKLLVEASNCLSPLEILEKVPLDTDVPGLRGALIRLLTDYSCYAQLQNGCYDSTLGDTRTLMFNYLNVSGSAVYVNQYQKCSLCGGKIVKTSADTRKLQGLRAFSCGHVFHIVCTEEARRPNAESGECIACSEIQSD